MQLAVANTSLQCMCCLPHEVSGTGPQWNTELRSVPDLAVQAVPAVHSLGHLQLNIVVGQRKVQKYFLPLSLSVSVSFFSAASGLHGLSINTPFAFIQYKSSAAGQTKGYSRGGRG